MLTYSELKAIQDGHRRNDDVLTLLREIKRLRELAAASYAVVGFLSLAEQPEEVRTAVSDLCNRLHQEPAVQGYLVARKKREDLEFRRRPSRPTPTPAAADP